MSILRCVIWKVCISLRRLQHNVPLDGDPFPSRRQLSSTPSVEDGDQRWEELPFCLPRRVPHPKLNRGAKPLPKKPGHYEAISRSGEKASLENVRNLPL